MIDNTQKTIPYRLSPAELENLRLLRKRMNPAASTSQAQEQEKSSAGMDARTSNGRHQDNPDQKGNRP